MSIDERGRETTRRANVRRGRRLEYLNIGWHSLEAMIAVAAGLVASSIALVAFGFDSLIEVSSGAVLLWRLHADARIEQREHIEARALKLIGVSFLLLATYVAFNAVKSLTIHESPDVSYIGIGLAVLSLIAMPLLARAKRSVAARINSRAMLADSRQTDICAYLSAVLLAGLMLNALLGWWWADPIAGVVMAPIIAKEGVEALCGETRCDEGAGHQEERHSSKGNGLERAARLSRIFARRLESQSSNMR